jgi:hypothetical protein
MNGGDGFTGHSPRGGVDVGVAQAAGFETHPDLAGTRLGKGYLLGLQRLAERGDHSGKRPQADGDWRAGRTFSGSAAVARIVE